MKVKRGIWLSLARYLVVVCNDVLGLLTFSGFGGGGGNGGGNGGANSAPVSNAGVDKNVKIGSLVVLDGSGSSDADGDALTYRL